MSRIGTNPSRNMLSGYKPARVTAAVLTYIPELKGYYHQRLDILKLMLKSLRSNTKEPFDLLVFDNGSCREVVEFLQSLHQAGGIDILMLSKRNLGKIGAFKVLMPSAPGELIAFADDDIYFYPGWLEESLRVYDAFPKTAAVSAVPVRNAAHHGQSKMNALLDAGIPGIEVSHERLIKDEWEVEWADSTGRDPQKHLAETKNQLDKVLRCRGTAAVASANHFQFLISKEVMLKVLPEEWSGALMGKMVEFDEDVDRLEYLRLSTSARLVRHLGNIIPTDLLNEAQDLEMSEFAGTTEAADDQHWLMRIPLAKKILWALHDRSYRIINNIKRDVKK